MAPQIYRNQKVWYHAYDLTTRLNSIALDYEAETQDDTTFGDDTRSMKGGLKMVAAQVEGFYDADPYDSALFSSIAIADRPFTFGNESSEGSVAYLFKGMTGDYSPFKNSVGEIISFSAGAKSTKSPLVRGTIMLNQSALDASGSGTARQLGAMTSGQTLYAALHVLGVDDPADTLDLVVESDSSSGFSTPATQITFDQVSAIGSQWKQVSGANADTWYRLSYTITGATPSFNVVVVLGIL